MPSFDIVSEVDNEEVRNAVTNASRELETRFDFRGVEASFSWDKDVTTLSAESDYQLTQMLDILRNKLVKRKVDPNTIDTTDPVHSGKSYSIKVSFKQGIDQPMSKKIIKLIKDNKLKVQTAIQGDKLRVTGKKRDDLQNTIALIKDANLGQPFQYNNFRD